MASRTILAIAVEASERKATAPAPTTLFGTNNRNARILRTAANDIIRKYLRSTTWLGASDFHGTWAFALQPGKYAYPLPPDWLHMIPGTSQRGNWPMGLLGPATPSTWARWISGGATVPAPMGWRIENGVMMIDPTPASAELVTVEYLSRYPVVTTVNLATHYDLTTKPPTAIAPFVPRDGYLDVPDYDVFDSLDDEVFQFDDGSGWDTATWAEEVAAKLKAIDPQSVVAPLPQVRQEAFTADTDRPAFNDDHVLSLGMTAMLRQALGKSYVEEMAEFEAELEAALALDGGAGEPFVIGQDRETVDVVPLEGGRWLIT